ncbi:hypothetical protein B0H14DRAFT_3140390 [Mycena olivaceomarginata]|nr:hypothetical protein B0H14DRAFT_3140390 [Mycena olivaceomarginata]
MVWKKRSRRKHLLKSSVHIETRGHTGNIAGRSPAVCPESRPSMDVVEGNTKLAMYNVRCLNRLTVAQDPGTQERPVLEDIAKAAGRRARGIDIWSCGRLETTILEAGRRRGPGDESGRKKETSTWHQLATGNGVIDHHLMSDLEWTWRDISSKAPLGGPMATARPFPSYSDRAFLLDQDKNQDNIPDMFTAHLVQLVEGRGGNGGAGGIRGSLGGVGGGAILLLSKRLVSVSQEARYSLSSLQFANLELDNDSELCKALYKEGFVRVGGLT